MADEFQNTVNSELGGVLEEYASIEVADFPEGKVPVIAPDLTVTFEDPPQKTQRDAARASLLGKLRGAIAGLTDEELDLLVSN